MRHGLYASFVTGCPATIGVLFLLWDIPIALSQGADGAPLASDAPGRTQLSLGMVFTCFMVMLGPMKLIGPFNALTSDMDQPTARKIALKAIGIACIGGVVAAVIGQNTLVAWGISLSALHLTGGIILLLVALKNVLALYEKPSNTKAAYPNLAFSPLAFPTILTPYGLAVYILLLAMTHDPYREALISALFLAMMAINLLVMWFSRTIIRRGGGVLAILGAVLGVLQVALAIQMILTELRLMRILPGSN